MMQVMVLSENITAQDPQNLAKRRRHEVEYHCGPETLLMGVVPVHRPKASALMCQFRRDA